MIEQPTKPGTSVVLLAIASIALTALLVWQLWQLSHHGWQVQHGFGPAGHRRWIESKPGVVMQIGGNAVMLAVCGYGEYVALRRWHRRRAR